MLEQLSFNVQKNQRNQRIHKKIIFILLQCLLAILIIENVCVVTHLIFSVKLIHKPNTGNDFP